MRRLRFVPGIRPCLEEERGALLAIVNAAAQAYRGVIPADRWHEPYMSRVRSSTRRSRPASCSGGTRPRASWWASWACSRCATSTSSVMPTSRRSSRGGGSAGRCSLHLLGASTRRTLVGTWAAAAWAIRFYERHGFEPVGAARTAQLLKAYWTIPERQIETSVVLEWAPADALSERARRERLRNLLAEGTASAGPIPAELTDHVTRQWPFSSSNPES